MSEDTSKESNVKDTVEAVTGLLKAIPVYQDTVQPAAQQIGKSLETITKTVNIALAPIKMLVWGYEQIEDFITKRVSAKLSNVSPENIITPPPQIAGPTVDALRYSGHNEELRELYANLLATSMDRSTTLNAHPGYVDIIKNITSDEARLLKIFVTEKRLPLIDIQAVSDDGSRNFVVAFPNFSKIMTNNQLEHSTYFPNYIDNLCRLGLLQIPFGLVITDETLYSELENLPIVESIKEEIKMNEGRNKTEFVRKMIELTSFGKQFLENVVIPKTSEINN